MGLLAWIAVGAIVGGIARLFIPIDRKLGCLGTILLGILGSFVGGLLGGLISGDGLELSASGWIGSIFGALVLLAIVRFADSGHRT